MSKPTVFISYSHEDEEWKDRLVTHLGVLERQGILDLWDDRRIGAGEDWYEEIQEAINRASVAILMVSANFLTSKFILSEEVPRLLERRKKEGLRIFPVIVKPCAWDEVKWLARIQARPKDGRPISGGDEYQIDTDLTAIAREVKAIIDHPVVRRYRGPSYVEFVLVVGRSNELAAVREDIESYGDEPVDWRPYYPEYERRVGPFVQYVVAREDFTSRFLQLAPDLIDKLNQAKAKNNIVVLIVDVWTIRLQRYHYFMREYDERSFLNCAVLIPWNDQNDETEQNRDTLENALRTAFQYKTVAKDPKSFREEITSFNQLDHELCDVLMEIRRRITETGEVARRAEAEGIIVQPQISGPGGG